MGMGIGMGMALGQQQQQQPAQQQQQPVSSPQPTDEQLAFMQAALAAMSPPPTTAPSPEASMGPSRQRSGDIVSNILSDNFLATRSPLSTSPPTGNAFPGFASPRRSSQTADLGSPVAEAPDADSMAKKDPLAAQVWKAYARAKETLPHGQRMENLTWRMMHLTMKKKEDAERAAAMAAASSKSASSSTGAALAPPPAAESSQRRSEHVQFQGLSPVAEPPDQEQELHAQRQREQEQEQERESQHRQSVDSSDHEAERGRRKGVSKVVGFSAGNRDSR